MFNKLKRFIRRTDLEEQIAALAVIRKDHEDRIDALEDTVNKEPDLIGFERVEPDEDVADWDDSNEIYPMKWETDDEQV